VKPYPREVFRLEEPSPLAFDFAPRIHFMVDGPEMLHWWESGMSEWTFTGSLLPYLHTIRSFYGINLYLWSRQLDSACLSRLPRAGTAKWVHYFMSVGDNSPSFSWSWPFFKGASGTPTQVWVPSLVFARGPGFKMIPHFVRDGRAVTILQELPSARAILGFYSAVLSEKRRRDL